MHDFEGELIASGPSKTIGKGNDRNVEYQYLRFEDKNKKEIYLESVIVPPRIDSYLHVGLTTRFKTVVIPAPDGMFKTICTNWLYAIVNDNREINEFERLKENLTSIKWAYVALLTVFGFLTIWIFGLGLVYWVRAYRWSKVTPAT